MAAPTAGLILTSRIGDATCRSVLKCHIHCASGHFTATGLRKYNALDLDLCEKRSLTINPVAELKVFRRFQFTHSSARLPNRRLDLPERSQEFISNLRSKERETLLAELLKQQNVTGDGPSTILDTELPETGVPTPTRQQLRLVAFSNALPFIGFGFFDNAIMIIAGDYIDVTIGGALSISTMAAAGLGNMISDVAGIGLAGTVEKLVSRVGVEVPVLTPEQQDLTRTRWTASMARAVGIAVGCFIGMFPLFFLKTKEDRESEDDEKGTT